MKSKTVVVPMKTVIHKWDAAFVTVIDLTGIAMVFARDQQAS